MRALDATDAESILYLMAASVVAGFVRGFSGFGGPAIISLLLTQIFTPITLIPKVMLIDFCCYPALLRSTRGQAAWKLVVPMGAGVLVAMPVGIWSMTLIDAGVLKQMIAAAAIAGVVLIMSGWRLARIPPPPVLVLSGLVLGWVLGATFIAIPLMAFMLIQPMPVREVRASIIMLSILSMPPALLTAYWNGLFTVADIVPVLAAGLVYLATVSLGAYVFRFAGEKDYRRVAYWLLLVLAVAAVVR